MKATATSTSEKFEFQLPGDDNAALAGIDLSATGKLAVKADERLDVLGDREFRSDLDPP